MKAVLFDLFETLVTEAGRPVTRASSSGPPLGLDGSAFRAEWKRMRSGVVLGERSFGDALGEISRKLAGRADGAAIRSLRERRIEEKAEVFANVDPAVARMLESLRRARYRLGVVSNCFAEDVTAWPNWAPSELFTSKVFSFEVGSAKPAPEIYLEGLRRLGVDTASCIFVGDGGDDELAGAERVGIRGFRAAWFAGKPSGSAAIPGDRLLLSCDDVVDRLCVVSHYADTEASRERHASGAALVNGTPHGDDLF